MSEELYPLVHKGFGRYEVDGQTYPTKEAAEEAQAKLLRQADEWDNIYGDIVPEGVTIRVVDHSLVFRGSLLEVPMNEVYLPDGDYNPMYDRAWYYAWAPQSGRGIASYRALGYDFFTAPMLDEMVGDGKAPAHYQSLLQRDGERLVFEDLVLMRTPRVRWRQRKAEEEQRSLNRLRRTEKEAEAAPYVPNFPGERVSLGT